MDTLVANHVRVFNQVKARLKEEFGLDEHEQVLLDSTDGETDLNGYLVRLIRQARERDAFAAALSEMMESMGKRKARLELGAEKLRSIVALALSETGQKKIEAADFTVSLANSKAPLRITNEVAAAALFERKQKPEVDRKALREALENGQEFWFASLGNPGNHLVVRKT